MHVNEKLPEKVAEKINKIEKTDQTADIVATINYLQQKASELQNYSTKLYKAVAKIASIFGPPDECMICGSSSRVHDERDNHPFTPKICLLIDFEDGEWFKEEELDYCNNMRRWLFLAIKNGKMWVVERQESDPDRAIYYYVDELDRESIKALVKSGAIPRFLQKLKKQLDADTEEYKHVSELAEKMASVIG